MFGLLLALCIDGLLSACMVSLGLVGRCCQLLLSFARKGLVVIISSLFCMSETLASDGELLSIAADPAGKWRQLPVAFRRDLGHVTDLPDAELIHNLCLDDHDRRAMLLPFAADAAELSFLCEIFKDLQVQLARKAALAQKRRALLDPSLQFLAAKRCCLQPPAPRIHSLAWLTSASGACQRARFCLTKRLQASGGGGSRSER